jgi:RNA polymerase sigma-70 factor (ECF subfamily)
MEETRDDKGRLTNADHLSEIVTLWSVVQRAHGDESTDAISAQQLLLNRYGGAIHRYLRAAVRDDNAADEIYQEFALRFVRGDFRNVDPQRGRFRSFLKTVLFRMVADHFRRAKRDAVVRPTPDIPELGVTDAPQDNDEFTEAWREELLKRTWTTLAADEKQTGKPFFTLLQLKLNHPDLRSADLAERLTQDLGRSISTANLRVLLHRSRERFADLLLEEVVHSLADNSRDTLEDELIDLRLLEYCRPAIERREDS